MKTLFTLLFTLAASLASAQAVVVPSPVPSCANNDVLKWNTATSLFICASAASTSQPLSDASGLIANSADPTKILAFAVSGITTATTRTWTIADANITVPSTIASLGANTFTALQTLNGGITTTTGIFSSTVSIAGATTLNTVAYTWPGSQGAADTFLKNNGSGTLSWGTQSAALPSPVTQNLIFTDNTYDIGASGATRPRNYFGAGNMTLGGTLGVTGASTITSLAATSGTFSTTLSVTGASTLAAISATSGSFSSIVTATGAITSSAGIAGTTGTFSSTVSAAGLITSTSGISGGPASHTTGTFSSTLAVTGVSSLGSVGMGQARASTDRLSIYGADTGSTNYMFQAYDSSGSIGIGVRNDGLVVTGLGVNSPYNATTGAAANLAITSGGLILRSTSARKYKQDEQPFTGGLRELLMLSPVTYEERGKPGPRYLGFIADDSVKITPLVISYGAQGQVEGYQYDRLTTYMVNAFKEVEARLVKLEKRK